MNILVIPPSTLSISPEASDIASIMNTTTILKILTIVLFFSRPIVIFIYLFIIVIIIYRRSYRLSNSLPIEGTIGTLYSLGY